MPHHRPLDARRAAALLRDPDVHARAAHDGPRRRGRGRLRDPVRHRDDLPDGRALRPRGDPFGLGAAAAVQPGARGERGRDALDRRLRRRAVSPGDTQRTYGQIEEALAPLVEAGVFPLALGGDHSVTLAELRVLARKHGPLALVQLDAHGDTWDEYFGQRYFHGTTFMRALEEKLIEPAASVQAGLRGSLYARRGYRVGARRWASPSSRATSCGRSGPGSFASLVRERARRPPGLPLLRRRRPRPGVRSGNGDAGGRRPLDGGGARLPTRAGWDRPRRRGRGRGLASVRRARAADGARRGERRLRAAQPARALAQG